MLQDKMLIASDILFYMASVIERAKLYKALHTVSKIQLTEIHYY